MKRALICAALFSLAAMAGPAAPQRHHVPTGTLSGRVLGPDDQPIAGARATIQQADGKHPHAKLTDAQGRFRFSLISTGPYDIRAFANGQWSDWQHNIIVYRGKTTEVTIHITGPANSSRKIPL